MAKLDIRFLSRFARERIVSGGTTPDPAPPFPPDSVSRGAGWSG